MRTRRNPSSSNLVSSRHLTVLLHEAVHALGIKHDSVVFDATLGSAGHAQEIIRLLDERGTYIGMDADVTAVDTAREILAGAQPRIILIHDNFRNVKAALSAQGISRIDAALFDLGWRIEQMEGVRGFSFRADGPLLMTYNPRPPEGMLTAHEIVNEWDEENIADVIYGWGGERYGRRIARAISEARTQAPIQTTQELVNIIAQAVPRAYARGRLHPATKTFQALRIAVNDEMGALKDGIVSAMDMLSEQGRLAVITFHSIEDRLVKNTFRDAQKAGHGVVLTKKPIVPAREEIAVNPRSRSAKLRIFEKTSSK